MTLYDRSEGTGVAAAFTTRVRAIGAHDESRVEAAREFTALRGGERWRCAE